MATRSARLQQGSLVLHLKPVLHASWLLRWGFSICTKEWDVPEPCLKLTQPQLFLTWKTSAKTYEDISSWNFRTLGIWKNPKSFWREKETDHMQKIKYHNNTRKLDENEAKLSKFWGKKFPITRSRKAFDKIQHLFMKKFLTNKEVKKYS